MSRVEEFYDETEFKNLLECARMNASTDWEENFIADLWEKFDEYKDQTFLSQSQQEHLERMASDD